MRARIVPLLCTLLLGGCGYRYHLSGHGPGRTAAVTMSPSEERIALTEGLIVAKLGYQLSLSSEDPEIVDVSFRNGNPRVADIALVAKKPGKTAVHYGNLFDQTLPFGARESRRLGVDLPSTEFERPEDGTGWRRQAWLRAHSDGVFLVEVK